METKQGSPETAQAPIPVAPSSGSPAGRIGLSWAAGALVAGAAVVLGLTFVLLEQRPYAANQPKLTWSTAGITVTRSPGGTSVQTVTLMSDTTLKNAQIVAVPMIAPFLTIQPSSLPALTANQPQSVRLSFEIPPSAALGTYDGTIQVRLSSQTLPQTLKVILNVWQPFSDQDLGVVGLLPPTFAITTTQAGSFSAQNYKPAIDESSEALSPGSVVIDISILPLSGNEDYQNRLSGSEALPVSGYAGQRGYRATADFSPIPGYDLYVPVNDKLYVVAGSYDGLTQSSVDLIRSFEQTLTLKFQ